MGWIDKTLENLGIQKSLPAIYVRVSSDEDDSQSLQAQLKACRRFCKKRGWTDIQEYIESPGTTADSHQPELGRLLTEIRDGKSFYALVVHTQDRLSRSPDRLAKIEKLLAEHGGQVVPVK